VAISVASNRPSAKLAQLASAVLAHLAKLASCPSLVPSVGRWRRLCVALPRVFGGARAGWLPQQAARRFAPFSSMPRVSFEQPGCRTRGIVCMPLRSAFVIAALLRARYAATALWFRLF